MAARKDVFSTPKGKRPRKQVKGIKIPFLSDREAQDLTPSKCLHVLDYLSEEESREKKGKKK